MFHRGFLHLRWAAFHLVRRRPTKTTKLWWRSQASVGVARTAKPEMVHLIVYSCSIWKAGGWGCKKKGLPLMFCDGVREHAAVFEKEKRILPTACFPTLVLSTICSIFGRWIGSWCPCISSRLEPFMKSRLFCSVPHHIATALAVVADPHEFCSIHVPIDPHGTCIRAVSLFLSVHFSIYISIYPYIYLYTYLSLSFSTYISIKLSIFLPLSMPSAPDDAST